MIHFDSWLIALIAISFIALHTTATHFALHFYRHVIFMHTHIQGLLGDIMPGNITLTPVTLFPAHYHLSGHMTFHFRLLPTCRRFAFASKLATNTLHAHEISSKSRLARFDDLTRASFYEESKPVPALLKFPFSIGFDSTSRFSSGQRYRKNR
jgi:hypothetical protein